MKVIPVNRVSGITATTENANYPATNMMDDHPKKVWKATTYTAELIVEVSGGASNALAIHNTNATGITFEVLDPNDIGWETGVDWEDGVEWSNYTYTVTGLTTLDGTSGAALVEWTEIDAILNIRITLSQSSLETLYIGVIDAGKLYTYAGPEYGLTESGKDYSVVSDMSNGSRYVKDRDYVRIFNVSLNTDRDTTFHSFYSDIVKVIKSNPRTWMVSDLNNSRWLVYGAITRHISGDHFNYERSLTNFEITEVV